MTNPTNVTASDIPGLCLGFLSGIRVQPYGFLARCLTGPSQGVRKAVSSGDGSFLVPKVGSNRKKIPTSHLAMDPAYPEDCAQMLAASSFSWWVVCYCGQAGEPACLV